MNVQQPPTDDVLEADPEADGEEMVDEIAETAGIPEGSYETRIIVSNDMENSILQAIEEYNTVCVGLSEQSAVSRVLFGSLAERVGQRATGNVMMIRGPEMGHRTVREAIVERLS